MKKWLSGKHCFRTRTISPASMLILGGRPTGGLSRKRRSRPGFRWSRAGKCGAHSCRSRTAAAILFVNSERKPLASFHWNRRGTAICRRMRWNWWRSILLPPAGEKGSARRPCALYSGRRRQGAAGRCTCGFCGKTGAQSASMKPMGFVRTADPGCWISGSQPKNAVSACRFLPGKIFRRRAVQPAYVQNLHKNSFFSRVMA